MFSEYASKYLSKSQRPAPLFNGAGAAESDGEDYLGAVSRSTDASLGSVSGSASSESESESVSVSESDDGRGAGTGQWPQDSMTADPPPDMLVERSRPDKRRPKRKTGYSLWARNVETWAAQSGQAPRSGAPHAGPSSRAGPAPSDSKPGRQPPQSSSRVPLQPPLQPHQAATSRGDSHTGSGADAEAGPRALRGKPLDTAVAAVYLVLLALSTATASLVSVAAPVSGGSAYQIFAYSARSLVAYTALATIISAVWLFAMYRCARALVQVSVFAVPVVLVATGLYSMVMSVHPGAVGWHGLAHAALRVSALAPFALAALWVAYLRRVRDVTGRGADVVVRCVEVYAWCAPASYVLTAATGAATLVVSGLWALFLARSFLEGRVGVLLAAWLTFMYLWTWGVLCALVRTVLTLLTAQWYAATADRDSKLPDGALGDAVYATMTFQFGSAVLSALVALVCRVPLLVLPKTLGEPLQRATVGVLAVSAPRLLDPLTLPTAVIERTSLAGAAHAVAGPAFASIDRSAYRLAKLFLVAARLCCAVAVGFAAWVHADRIADASSAYGYLVAITALFIGWTVMGASENLLSMISDALLVNFALGRPSPRRAGLERLFASPPADAPLDPDESVYSDATV